jgi:hypothetical protein
MISFRRTGRRTLTAGEIVMTGLVLSSGLALLVLAGRRGLHIVSARSLDDLPAFLALSSATFIVLLVARARLLALGGAINRPTCVQSVEGYGVEVWEGWELPDPRVLRSLGGRREFITPWIWTFVTKDEQSLGQLLMALRDLGVPFVAQPSHAWPPAGVFDELRKRGLVTGSYMTTESWRPVRKR